MSIIEFDKNVLKPYILICDYFPKLGFIRFKNCAVGTIMRLA